MVFKLYEKVLKVVSGLFLMHQFLVTEAGN